MRILRSQYQIKKGTRAEAIYFFLSTANMKTIIEEMKKVTKSKNGKLTEIIHKAINVKQSWSEYSNYSNSSVQIVLFVFVFVWFLQVE